MYFARGSIVILSKRFNNCRFYYYRNQLNKELALRFGAVGYITKPVELAELLKTISRLLPVA